MIGPGASLPRLGLILWSERLILIGLLITVVDCYLAFAFVFDDKRYAISITDLIGLLLTLDLVPARFNPLQFFRSVVM